MAKYDDQLNRMLFLMEDKNATKKPASNVEYHANGADGKVYGILKEGTKYYIKTTESGKENLAESYDYINGFTNRRENEYKSYNEATKQLELKLMSLNEAYGKKEKTSTVDFNRTEKTFANLTESARKELDRMHQIFENSCKIGMNCVCDPESKGKATAENTTKNNAPFEEKATASLDKDPKFNGTVKDATENKEVKGVESDLESDKKKTANTDTKNDYKATHDDLDGEGVADKKPSGAKAVKMNEGCCEIAGENPELESNIDSFLGTEELPSEENVELGSEDDLNMGDDITTDDFEDPGAPEFEPNGAEALGAGMPEDTGLAGMGDEEIDEFDQLLEDFEKNFGKGLDHSNKDAIVGPDEVMDNYDSKKGTDGKDAEWERINEEDGNVNEPTKQGNEETMKSFQKKGNLPVQSWDKMDKKQMNEAISNIVEDVFKKLTKKEEPKKTTKKETLQEAIDRIVKEEITKLDAWGKHPRYRKEPMTTPANKEILAGTADRDINDDSAKGEQPYGQKIGDGKPFDKLVNMLTDQVMAQLTAKK